MKHLLLLCVIVGFSGCSGGSSDESPRSNKEINDLCTDMEKAAEATAEGARNGISWSTYERMAKNADLDQAQIEFLEISYDAGQSGVPPIVVATGTYAKCVKMLLED